MGHLRQHGRPGPHTEQEAALQDYAQRVLIHGPLTKDNLDAFLDFYRCGAEESEREKRSAEAFRKCPGALILR